MKKKKQTNPVAEQVAAAAAALAAEATTPDAMEAQALAAAAAPAAQGGVPTDTSEPADSSGPVPTAQEKTEADVLHAFLGAISKKERAALLAALAHLSDAERAREKEAALAAEEAAITEMEKERAFSDIRTRRAALQALCASVEWLARLPLRERLAAAYYIDRGVRYGEPTREELLHAVLSDGGLLRELELRRREAAVGTARTLPPVGRTHGLGAVPATVKKSPRSLDEAQDAAKKFLRFYQ